MSIEKVIQEASAEFRQRYAGRFYGKYRARVHSISDPEQAGRIKVTCPRLFGDAVTAWCWPSAPSGSNSNTSPAGFFSLPAVGDMVWIELEEGNTGRPPIWTGGPWSRKSAPDHVRALPDESDEGIKGIEGAPVGPSTFNSDEYGKVHTWQMPSGSRIEFDETPGEERVQVYHRSGAHLEILSDGTINLAAAGNLALQATGGAIRRYASGKFTDTIDSAIEQDWHGPVSRNVATTETLTIIGEVKQTYGKQTLIIEGDQTYTVKGSRATTIVSNERLTVGGQLVVFAGTDVLVQGSGAVSIVAQNNITNGGLPTDLAMELTAYNGRARVMSTDATGLISDSILELDSALGSAIMTADVRAVLDAPLVQLGGDAAVDPLVLGLGWSALFTALITWLDTHTHIGNSSVPTSPPVVPSTTTLSSMITTALSITSFTE